MGDNKKRKKVSIFDEDFESELEELKKLDEETEEIEELEENSKYETVNQSEKKHKNVRDDEKTGVEEEKNKKKEQTKSNDDEDVDDFVKAFNKKKESKSIAEDDKDLWESKKMKKDVSEKKDIKKIEKTFMEDDDEDNGNSSIIGKIIFGIVILVIIIILLFKACNKGADEYRVIFDSNGGSEVASLVVKADGTIKEPEAPTKEGYDFAGWYYNDTEFDFNTPITNDITLEARWVEAENVPVSGVEVDQNSLELSPGSTSKIVATVKPDTAKDKSLTWVSSNPDVVTVDEQGNIKGVKVGSAVITVTTNDGAFTATVKVTVSEDIVAVTGVSLNKSSLALGPNESANLVANVTPSNASNKGVTWTSSNTSIATVSSTGTVTALKDGTVTITATTKDGSFTATATVTVKTVKVTGISVNKTTVSVKEGKVSKVVATVSPSNATNKNVTWSSANSGIAKVSSTGVITGVKEGTTTITVKTADGNYTKTINVTVLPIVEAKSVAISGNTSGTEGGKITLKAIINPSDTDDKTVTWTSSNTSIATVSSTGVVTLKKAGTVTITAETKNGKKATHTITIKEKAASYAIILTALKDELGSVTQYSILVTKNGSEFKDFKGFNYQGTAGRPEGTIPATIIDKNVKSVDLVLSDGTTAKDVPISYK